MVNSESILLHCPPGTEVSFGFTEESSIVTYRQLETNGTQGRKSRHIKIIYKYFFFIKLTDN